VKARRKAYAGIYGNVVLAKERCWECQAHAFVLDGCLACCGKPARQIADTTKREISPEFRRRRPPRKKRDEQLERQNGLCAYCDRVLGSYVFRGGCPKKLEIEWDHVVPFSYSQNNKNTNFVAACCVCNHLKSSTMYPNMEAARSDLQRRFIAKGYV